MGIAKDSVYRLDMTNLNTVKLKLYLIQGGFKIFAKFLSFQC